MYLSISRATMDVINCQDTDPPSGKMFMASMPLEECNVPGGLQLRVLPAALIFLVAYCIGFPIIVLVIFYRDSHIIFEDQVLRAHGRGMHPLSNTNYEFRQRFSRLYYQYKPTCYWWIIVIVLRKFAICFAGVALRNSATFQLCFALVVMFGAFVLQVVYHPFLGIRERGHLLREENTKNMAYEAKRLRAMLVVQRMLDDDIRGDDLAFQHQMAQQDKIRSLDSEREAIDLIIHRKHRWWFNENNIELTLLGASVLVPLAGIMFNSRYLERPGTETSKSVITYTVIVVVVSSVVYFIAVFTHAIFHTREANRISPQIYWARLRINLSVVVEKMKGSQMRKKQMRNGITAVKRKQKGVFGVVSAKNNPIESNHVAMMAEMMAKLESQISRLEKKEDRMHDTLREVSVRVARQEMVAKTLKKKTPTKTAIDLNSLVPDDSASAATPIAVMPAIPAAGTPQERKVSRVSGRAVTALMMSSSEEESDDE